MADINTDSLFILSGPSGAGEDSIIEGLSEEIEIERVITTTSRDQRPNEVDGEDYHFISKEEFEARVEEDDFFEYAEQDNGNLYGTTLKELQRVASADAVGVLKVDYKGVETYREKLEGIIAIMIYTSKENLAKRIQERGTSSDEFVQDRIKYAQGWFENTGLFDYKVENAQGKLDRAVEDVLEIITNECPQEYIHYK
ncbi:MAG: guanylate kinase [Candidatus Paceibacteria bacterium]